MMKGSHRCTSEILTHNVVYMVLFVCEPTYIVSLSGAHKTRARRDNPKVVFAHGFTKMFLYAGLCERPSTTCLSTASAINPENSFSNQLCTASNLPSEIITAGAATRIS